MSQRLADALGARLDREVRWWFDRTWQSMWRDLEYLDASAERHIVRARLRGWTLDRLRAVAVLNAFNRVVLGPLNAAYRTPTQIGLGSTTRVSYGPHFAVSSETAQQVEPALNAFADLVRQNGLKDYWLSATRVADIVFAISNDGQGELDDGDPNG